jgi:hypothetical protein
LRSITIAAEVSTIGTLAVQVTTAAAAIASVLYAVVNDHRRAGRASLNVSIGGDTLLPVVANLGPADASEVTVELQSEDPRFIERERDWKSTGHIPIENLGRGGHYVLLLPRRIPLGTTA